MVTLNPAGIQLTGTAFLGSRQELTGKIRNATAARLRAVRSASEGWRVGGGVRTRLTVHVPASSHFRTLKVLCEFAQSLKGLKETA